MAKIKSKWICQKCGYETIKYMGKCPDCGKYGVRPANDPEIDEFKKRKSEEI